MTAPLLEIVDLTTIFQTPAGAVRAVDGVSLTVRSGETLGIVGESGSGKSQTLFSIMGLLPPNATVSGSVRFEDVELLGLGTTALNELRGDRLSLIFQDPMTALNPYLTIAQQLVEVPRHHHHLSRGAARAAALDALQRVHIPEAERQLGRYPHELSGGMRQRVMIAMAIIGNPALLLADEPTTALDVTIQAEILDLLAEQSRAGMAVVLVTHDLGVIARLCARVVVMYAGRIVESGGAAALFTAPRHPYTAALLQAIPRLDDDLAVPRPGIDGQAPNPLERPPGCAFAPRCAYAFDLCRTASPRLLDVGAGRAVACHRDAAGMTLP